MTISISALRLPALGAGAMLLGAFAGTAGAEAVTPAQEQIREHRTGADFPVTVDFRHGGRSYELTLTGTAARRIALFNIYGIAHYVEAGSASAAGKSDPARMLRDGRAKQITLYFARDLRGERISKTLVKSIRRNADANELAAAAPAISRFADVVRHDVKKGERFTVRWLPGGVVVSIFHGKEVFNLRDETFVRLLWSVWFGDNAVVDRASLLDRVARPS